MNLQTAADLITMARQAQLWFDPTWDLLTSIEQAAITVDLLAVKIEEEDGTNASALSTLEHRIGGAQNLVHYAESLVAQNTIDSEG